MGPGRVVSAAVQLSVYTSRESAWVLKDLHASHTLGRYRCGSAESSRSLDKQIYPRKVTSLNGLASQECGHRGDKAKWL